MRRGTAHDGQQDCDGQLRRQATFGVGDRVKCAAPFVLPRYRGHDANAPNTHSCTRQSGAPVNEPFESFDVQRELLAEPATACLRGRVRGAVRGVHAACVPDCGHGAISHSCIARQICRSRAPIAAGYGLVPRHGTGTMTSMRRILPAGLLEGQRSHLALSASRTMPDTLTRLRGLIIWR